MHKKQMHCQQEGKRPVSVHPKDIPALDSLLSARLRLFDCNIADRIDGRSKVSRPAMHNNRQPRHEPGAEGVFPG
jgi:hypothetical protein